jgi:chromosome segregation ATPase
MDDARISSEMTMAGIAQKLDAIQSDLGDVKQDVSAIKNDVAVLKTDVAVLKTDVAVLKTDMAGVKTDIAGLMYEVKSGFERVDTELNDARIRDEQLHSLMKFGLEAREALRETVAARFDETDRRHEEAISLLKDVLQSRHPTS